MKKRMSLSRKYSKKIFRKTAGVRNSGKNVHRPFQRGGWRM